MQQPRGQAVAPLPKVTAGRHGAAAGAGQQRGSPALSHVLPAAAHTAPAPALLREEGRALPLRQHPPVWSRKPRPAFGGGPRWQSPPAPGPAPLPGGRTAAAASRGPRIPSPPRIPACAREPPGRPPPPPPCRPPPAVPAHRSRRRPSGPAACAPKEAAMEAARSRRGPREGEGRAGGGGGGGGRRGWALFKLGLGCVSAY